MLYIHRSETDPFFNIAAEEYFLKQYDEDIIMLWANEPSVIIGKHQNAFAEINPDFARQKKLPVVRRISGGGAVYHDRGNLNFSFILNGEMDKLVNYRKYTGPVIEFLQSIGVGAEFKEKNSIVANGRKISGNSEHVYKNRVLHHGTLLFDTNLEVLEEVLTTNRDQYIDKAIRSVRSSVANIVDFLPKGFSFERFRNELERFLMDYFSPFNETEHRDRDVQAIQKLAEEKYKTWDWNFGYSPNFSVEAKIADGRDEFGMEINVESGIIRRVNIAESLAKKYESQFNEVLSECHFDKKAVTDQLNKLAISEKLTISF